MPCAWLLVIVSMRLKIDKESDALYFRLDESAIVDSQDVESGVVLDFNSDGNVIGIEILDLSKESSAGVITHP